MHKHFAIVAPITTLLLTCLATQLAWGQSAEVPKPDSAGDFKSSLVLGNRGKYKSNYWLVIDPERLNCRTSPSGAVKLQLEPGEVVTAAFPEKGDAIVIEKGQTWLRAKTIASFFRKASEVCYVRANLKYIAPINEDVVEAVRTKP
jgi:hypothetical protein